MGDIFPGHAPHPRAMLGWDGTSYRVLAVDAAGRPEFRGENQPHTFADTLEIYVTGALTEADGYLETAAVPEDVVWVITNIILENEDRNITSSRWCRFSAAVVYCFGCVTRAIPLAERTCWHGWEWAKEDDTIRGQFVGGQIGDTCHMWITGYTMSKDIRPGPAPPILTYQDFTTWVEVDPGADITIVADTITVDDLRRDHNSYVYLDMGVDYFGDFVHYLTARFTDVVIPGLMGFWGLSNGDHTIEDKSAAGVGVSLHWTMDPAPDAQWVLTDWDTGESDVYIDSYNATRYLTIRRSGTTLTCRIYSDAARTVLLDTLSIVCAPTLYRYVEMIQSRDGDGAPGATIDGWVSDFAWYET